MAVLRDLLVTTRQWANCGPSTEPAKLAGSIGTPGEKSVPDGVGNNRQPRQSFIFWSVLEKRNQMSNETKPKNEFFQTVLVPTAKGLERFFWNLLWFAVFVAVLFGLPRAMQTKDQTQKGDRAEKQHVGSTKSDDLPDPQPASEGR
jgi:hypothetical protein